MRISWKWLNEFCKIPLSPEEAAERLTLTGCEVESIERPCSALKGLIVGRIEKLRVHPERADLFVAELDLGGPRAQCVTAARNLKEGDFVPYGAPGSAIADGTVLGKREFDSVTSVGMMLSAEEIGLPWIAEEFGILRLPRALVPGEDLVKALGLDDCILEISITPNRGDLLSLMGLARECHGVIPGAVLERKELRPPQVGNQGTVAWDGLTLEDPGCPLYGLSFAPSVKIEPSPLETRIRLAFSGVRSINNIVDATNAVMLITGQPLHAFDLDRLPAREITVRGASEGERFRTLDGKEHVLADGDLLITSGGVPVALAGIMGGENSEITPETKSVAFESAFFEPLRVSRTARRLGMGTEASYRFSRGVDPSRVLPTLSCLAEFLWKETSQRVEEKVRVVSTRTWDNRRITLTRRKMHRILLWDDLDKASELLQRLDLREISGTAEERLFEIPTSRADLSIEEDLIEEVGRLKGYESVPSRIPPLLHGTGRVGEEVEAHRRIRVAAMSRGYLEIVTYSFINPRWVEWLRIPETDPRSRGFRLTNPISQDQSLMRTTLLPGLLQALQTNLRSGWKDPIRLFEVGRVFLPGIEGEEHREILRMAGISWNGKERRLLHETCLKDDVLSLKADVLALCGSRGRTPGFSSGLEPFGHAGQTAQVTLEGKPCGYLTSIKPGILRELEIPAPVFAFELDIEPLLPEKGFRFGQVVRYPAVYRDISLIAPVGKPVASIEEDIRALGGDLLRGLVLFDLYQGTGIPDGTRSRAYSLAYGDPSRTLRDEEVDAIHDTLRRELAEKGYVLR
ncbi:MAG: phenylalanine--tRNA ligase subunit beta [Synergistaceae bacterium]|nr:phenylalanine--tRNA ligase subunit beta [Synergistaceae bacterium]